ncbi:cytochrome P450 [Bradyrhizobium elkanii]|uniref:Cytochrome P450 n=1 Tax=Bradyrhizobium elkanii TaxID=29448 RepID=A0A8I1Y4A7_BRAEL|nr:cytochrome P450 [Bradyrhizobium elkanii]MBP1291749.1 cytochrome P450 [Bradyrhizobium elkanii]WLA99586.1 cytochrome P450 [Bradyrhizobium elkanii]
MFITRFPDVQEALSRPDIFNVTYAPMMDPSVGPFMLGRDCTEINQRDKGIMRAFMRMEDLPAIRQKVRSLANASVEKQIYTQNQIEVVSTLSRLVPIQLTREYFGFPGPDLASMFRWSRATQYDMFHNLDKDPKVHQDNIDAGQEMRAYLTQLLPQRREQLKNGAPLEDVFSRLLNSHFDDSIGFADERIITNMMGTLVGGIETTSAAIVQLLDELFKRPRILKEAIDVASSNNDHLMYRYCWEALRFNPINPFVVRHCRTDYRIAKGSLRATTIKAGSTVLISTRSAMRDGLQLPAPSSFAIDRPESVYMHLGYGMHTCLGDQISRIQVPEIVRRILQIRGVRPAAEIDYAGGPFPERYPITYDTPV